MSKLTRLPRRTFLKGIGTTMALPMLEAMMPRTTLAKPGRVGLTKAPVRMAG